MAEITAAAVRSLRERTDLPMMRCKKALVEADGDEEKAIEILSSQTASIRSKRADNATTEGRIFVATKEDGSEAAIVDFQCETAPVATNEGFIALGEAMVQQLLDGPGAETAAELLSQNSPMHAGSTLQEALDDLVNKIAEKFDVVFVAKMAGPVGNYIHHDGKTAALFQASGENMTAPSLREIAMHVAAMKPTFACEADVDADKVKAERERLSEEARATGKPDNIIDKIVDGRMKNFFQTEGVLSAQAFAKDDTKTVAQVLAADNLEAKAFIIRSIG